MNALAFAADGEGVAHISQLQQLENFPALDFAATVRDIAGYYPRKEQVEDICGTHLGEGWLP